MFVTHYILRGKYACQISVAGFFYVCPVLIYGSVPPCGVLMYPLPLRCNATGKAEPSFFSVYTNIISEMHYTEKGLRGKNSTQHSTSTGDETPVNQFQSLHKENRNDVIQGLYNKSINQLVNDYIVEMDAKNEAYYFILENKLLNQFKNYCDGKK